MWHGLIHRCLIGCQNCAQWCIAVLEIWLFEKYAYAKFYNWCNAWWMCSWLFDCWRWSTTVIPHFCIFLAYYLVWPGALYDSYKHDGGWGPEWEGAVALFIVCFGGLVYCVFWWPCVLCVLMALCIVCFDGIALCIVCFDGLVYCVFWWPCVLCVFVAGKMM